MKTLFSKKAFLIFFAVLFQAASAFAANITVNGAGGNNGVYTVYGAAFTIAYTGSNGLAQLSGSAGTQLNNGDVRNSYSGSYQVSVSAPGTYQFKLQSSIQPGLDAGVIQYFAVTVK